MGHQLSKTSNYLRCCLSGGCKHSAITLHVTEVNRNILSCRKRTVVLPQSFTGPKNLHSPIAKESAQASNNHKHLPVIRADYSSRNNGSTNFLIWFAPPSFTSSLGAPYSVSEDVCSPFDPNIERLQQCHRPCCRNFERVPSPHLCRTGRYLIRCT